MKLRKILSLFLVAALFIGFSSCSKDDDTTTPTSIVGSWNYVSSSFDVKASTPSVADLIKSLLDDELDLPSHVMTFNENGTYQQKSSTGVTLGSGTYTYSNGKLTTDEFVANLSMQGNTMSIDINLMDNLSMIDDDDFSLDYLTMLGITKLSMVMKYTKQ